MNWGFVVVKTGTACSVVPALRNVREGRGTHICGRAVEVKTWATRPDALKSLKQGVARRLIGEAEHFWQKRYYDFNIRNHDQFVEKLHYTHCNPVNAGLCARPEDWPWSSFLHHASGCEGRIEIESEWTARKRERAAGSLRPAVALPHSSQNRA
jgi:hypothetical protein